MFKKTFLATATLLVICLASCKKNYTCECKDDTGSTASVTYKETKKKAKDACDKLNSAAQGSGTTCSLK